MRKKTDDVHGSNPDGLILTEENRDLNEDEYRLKMEIDKKIEEGDPAFGVFFNKVCEKLFGRSIHGELEHVDRGWVFHGWWISPLQASVIHKNASLEVALWREIPGNGKPSSPVRANLTWGGPRAKMLRKKGKAGYEIKEGGLFAVLYLILGPLTCHTIFLIVYRMLQIDSTPMDILAIITSYAAVPASYFFIILRHLTLREERATDEGFIRLVSAVKGYPPKDASSNRNPYWEMAAEAIPHGRMKDTGLTAFFDIYHQTHGAGNISPDTFMKNKENLAAILKKRFGAYIVFWKEHLRDHIYQGGSPQEIQVKLTPRKNETEIEFYSYLSGNYEKVGFISVLVLIFTLPILLILLLVYGFFGIFQLSYVSWEMMAGAIFLGVYGGMAIGAGVSFMFRTWRKGKIRRGLPVLLNLLQDMSNNPGQEISYGLSSEAKGHGLLGIPTLILGGMTAAVARVSFIRPVLFRVLPVFALNAAGFSEGRFVKADYLPMEEAIDHVWKHRSAMMRVREVYWSEVDNKKLKADSSSAREKGELQKKWLEDLVRYWAKNDYLFFEVDHKEYMVKTGLRLALKTNGIPWPPTWR